MGTTVTTEPSFAAWLRAQMAANSCVAPSGRYMLREFRNLLIRLAEKAGEDTTNLPDDASLSRYVKGTTERPTPETCRALARALGIKPVEVLRVAGYINDSDF